MARKRRGSTRPQRLAAGPGPEGAIRGRLHRFSRVFSSLRASATAQWQAAAGSLPVLLTTQRPEAGQNGRQLLPSAEATQWE